MIVYTAQHHDVVRILAARGVYFPHWAKSRPFASADASDENKQRAYLWMAKQYASFRRRTTVRPLIYSFLDISKVELIRLSSDMILTLEIPDEWVLLSKHPPWSTQILAGTRVTPEDPLEKPPQPRALSDEETWDTIFDIKNYKDTLQGVFDRVKHAWLKTIKQ